MEFLSKILQKLTPQEDWDSFQEEKSITLSKKIRLLIQIQKESNKVVKDLLSLNDSREVSVLIREDAENHRLILGSDPILFKKLLNEYPSFYLEFSKVIENLLKGDNLSKAIRHYGIIPVLTNLSSLLKKDLLTQEKYLEIVQNIYPPKTIKSLMALSELMKKALSKDSRQEMLQIALEQGVIDIYDLAYDEEDINLLKNFIRKSIKLPNDRYSNDRINEMFNDLRNFLISIKQVLFPILNSEIKDRVKETTMEQAEAT